jgi:hypothetical protein
MVLSENTYLTRDGLWRELDALGEHQVRLRLAEGAYRDRTRLFVEEWLRQQAEKRPLEQNGRRITSRAGHVESLEPLRIERRDDKIISAAATAAIIAAIMATIAATVSLLTYVRPP